MKLIILSTLLSVCLAEPPVPNYLPPNQNQVPLSNYLPSNQVSNGGHSPQSSNPGASYLPPNQGYPSGPDSGNRRPPQKAESPVPNYLPPNQNQVPSSNYLPSNQVSQGGNSHQSSNSGASYLPPNQGYPSGPDSGNRRPPQKAESPVPNYLPPNQNQVPSSNYLPSNQVSQGGNSHQSSNPGASYLPPNQGYTSGPDNGNRRPQQEVEKNAAILRQNQEINEHGYHFAYETSNGIRAEESGDTWQSQGGFSYKGDDGITYTVTYTAGENGGFQPRGDHLPVAPPIPEDILAALKKNEEDEAKGIFDDGKYRPDEHGGNSNQQGGYSNHQGGYSNHQGGNSNHQGGNTNSGYKY